MTLVHVRADEVEDPAVRRAIRLEARRELSRRDLAAWCDHGPPADGQAVRLRRWQRHLAAELQRVSEAAARGEAPRLIVEAPPQHGKSLIVSQRWPVWHLATHGGSIAVCSYADSLATELSRRARETARSEEAVGTWSHLRIERTVAAAGGYARNDTDRLDDWACGRGRYLARGVGQGLTGRTVSLVVIDDPIKDWAQAASKSERDSVWSWYRSVVMTRALANGAGIVIMHTRWHVDDLVGRVLDLERAGGERWRRLRYPGLAEVGDELGRAPGEALDPSRMTEADHAQARITLGSRQYAALYGQDPTPDSGGIIAREWTSRRYADPPLALRRTCDLVVASLDAASTAGGGDYSVIQVWGVRGPTRYLLHQWRDRVGYPELRAALRDVVTTWRPSAVVVEDASSGRPLVQDLRREIPGIVPRAALGSKAARLVAVSGVWASGHVELPAAEPWVGELVEEIVAFPAAHDDQVDAMSHALGWIAERDAGAAGVVRRSALAALGA